MTPCISPRGINMEALKIAITEDEEDGRKRIKRLLTEAHCDVVGSFPDHISLSNWLKQKPQVDALFLDVHTPKVSGLDFYTSLKEKGFELPVVYVTGHPVHAVKAFELSALDFLVKPVLPERLEMALEKVRGWMRNHTIQQKSSSKIAVQTEDGSKLMMWLTEITHFRYADRNIFAWDNHNSFKCCSFHTLTQIEEEFPDQYLRIQKDILLRPESVTAFKDVNKGLYKNLLVGIGNEIRLEVSRSASTVLRRRLGI